MTYLINVFLHELKMETHQVYYGVNQDDYNKEFESISTLTLYTSLKSIYNYYALVIF